MFRLARNNRGFSMAEVVIAMAIVGLVTAAALVIMIGSVDSTQKTFNKAEAENFVANAVECYIAAVKDVPGQDITARFINNMVAVAGYTPNNSSAEYVTFDLSGGYQGQVIVTQQSLNVCVYDTAEQELYIDWLTYSRGARR
ncbi:MAG: type II secretion system protein [Clostridia bacterium]|nr:type II secretion system protein [Clostridia bacterium]